MVVLKLSWVNSDNDFLWLNEPIFSDVKRSVFILIKPVYSSRGTLPGAGFSTVFHIFEAGC